MKLCGKVELWLYAFHIQHCIKMNDHVLSSTVLLPSKRPRYLLNRRVSDTQVWSVGLYNRRASIITCSECVFVALGLQNAMRIAILSPVASPALQYFPTLFHKGTIFEK